MEQVTSKPLTINLVKYLFTSDQEEIAARQLTALQKQNIENLIADIIEEKMRLAPVMKDPEDYFLKIEYLRGQIEILNYLLALSETTYDPKATD